MSTTTTAANNTRSDPPGVKDAATQVTAFVDLEGETPPAANTTTLHAPLLPKIVELNNDAHKQQQQQQDDLSTELIKQAKFYASCIGLVVGFFIQLSSLGANYLFTAIWGTDFLLKGDFTKLSLMWCFTTSVMGVLILLSIRKLVVLSFRGITAKTSSSSSNEQSQETMADLIFSVECSFAFFSLVGVCVSWAITDLFLGMRRHILQSLLTLAVASVWCKLFVMFCAKGHKDGAANELKSPPEQAAGGVVVVVKQLPK